MCNTYRKFKTRFLRYSFSAARKLNVRSAQLVTKYGYLVKAEIPNSRSESLGDTVLIFTPNEEMLGLIKPYVPRNIRAKL